ncbi:Phosphoglucomutase/phosphomannomutase alpha/beta/alpha domain [Elusimicrobium minutum Pei191]|uniref:Phosphoglucomutase/phosphomannomutase alpha/beta/alpha domain n=1 Tax=Elusimicrobium minutum (strain Pei191) TaxID=445932 RepID=B2KE73_ELUMP|nr:alpha-D-glucose phosphate-specific phosphoglucomutase [Elusimicrobium minutum]ACC98819.1 Phosphoglucomutase/phosphomannomutase alpha/beta/alpha domain [Elusimicrobium minutum Pei191]
MADINAGKLPVKTIDMELLKKEFFNPSGSLAKVKFGTSGHRGELGKGFCALHAKAIAQAVAKMHKEDGIKGPVLVGGDTRLMSKTVSEICACILAANGIDVILPSIPLPTPVFSMEILLGRACACLNGTASHNPPQDMGLKYNPSNGGPADSSVTSKIEEYANYFMATPSEIKEIGLEEAKQSGLIKEEDVITPYITELAKVIDFDAIKEKGLKAAIHPMGGTSLPFYKAIKEKYKLDNLTIVNETIDPTFYFIPLDHDGKTRMDPSSQYPMKPLIDIVAAGEYDFAGASDPDADRFGCATKEGGLINPNHALCVMAEYLISKNKSNFDKYIGRTLGTTHLLDFIAKSAGVEIDEQNVGFKYFVQGIKDGKYILCGEESAGMSKSGWTTEKDGIFAVLLLLEIMSKNADIAYLYKEITKKYGVSYYTRVDIPTDDETKAKVKSLKATDVASVTEVAGEKVEKVRDTDGIKIYLQNSWFLVRPSGTENIIKFYCESFISEEQMLKIVKEGSAALGIKLS